jgi:hypothetical protein
LSIEPLLEDLGTLDLTSIDWVIVGGESGPRARPMRGEWVESIYRQCRSARVPFFFKQWGGKRKLISGRLLHDRTYDEFPQIFTPSVPNVQEQRERAAMYGKADQEVSRPRSSLLVQLTA